jgi:hypothetical protein
MDRLRGQHYVCVAHRAVRKALVIRCPGPDTSTFLKLRCYSFESEESHNLVGSRRLSD